MERNSAYNQKDSALSAGFPIHIHDFTLHIRDLLNGVKIRFLQCPCILRVRAKMHLAVDYIFCILKVCLIISSFSFVYIHGVLLLRNKGWVLCMHLAVDYIFCLLRVCLVI